ncbi:MAG: UDP-N-acetylmuramate--L-alanine ligase, partial [Actinomycetota bacterium]
PASWQGRRVHFVGIGGSGMSGIAKIALARGAHVSGSDLHHSSVLESLKAAGVAISVPHNPSNIEGMDPKRDLVVRSSAVPEKNSELIAAHEGGIPIWERAHFLAELMAGYRSVAVAGTHGKTTTTSMATVALQHCRLDPSFAIGAAVRNSGTNAHHGTGDIFVVEADESDGSFTAYKPDGAIITNIELDHVDNFKDLESIDKAFQDFIRSIASQGFLVACIDDPGVIRALEFAKKNRSDITITTYGESKDADLVIDRIFLEPRSAKARFTLRGRVLGEIELAIPGQHNILNSAAALLAGIELGAPAGELIAGLALFTGARRRFEIKAVSQGITVVDDYGHHPTEIRATLETARNFAGAGRVIAIFQPHRFTRTQAFASEFALELSRADLTYLLEVYPASEKPIPGITSLSISSKMDSEKVIYQPSMPEVIASVVAQAKPGDVIITLGAGDVSSLGPLIAANLSEV